MLLYGDAHQERIIEESPSSFGQEIPLDLWRPEYPPVPYVEYDPVQTKSYRPEVVFDPFIEQDKPLTPLVDNGLSKRSTAAQDDPYTSPTEGYLEPMDSAGTIPPWGLLALVAAALAAYLLKKKKKGGK